MKVDKLIERMWQSVKAISTYNSRFKVIASIEMDEIARYKDVVASYGKGPPRLAVDLKDNEKRGLEVDIVFFGRHNVERMEMEGEDTNWKTFGHIVITPMQALELGAKIIQIGLRGLSDFSGQS